MPGKKLLVADDSLTIQKVIRLALSNEGYEIQAVADGNDAINQILLFRPDVVLIDVSLPSKNAFEVKRETNSHEDLLETRFVLISSAFEKVDELQVEEVEFHGRLTKPFDPAHLRNVLSTVLAQVTAKRMEPTSFLRKPPPMPSIPMNEPSEIFEYSRDEDDEPSLQLEDHPSLPIPPKKKSAFKQPSRDLPDLPPILPEDEDILPPSPPEIELTPPPPPMSDSTGETDIQRLTESTMRISGMDDYQWSMNEPSMKPPPIMYDTGGTNFNLDPENERLSHSDSSDPFPPPPPLSSRDEESSIGLPPLPPSLLENDEQVSSSYYSDPDSRSEILASEEKIDAMIHNQVEAVLEKMIEKILPQIAEKLIKDEIRRLLSE